MTTQLSRVQLRVLAALFVRDRTMAELCEHWPRANKPLKRLERQGYVSVEGDTWSVTPKGEAFWKRRLTRGVA